MCNFEEKIILGYLFSITFEKSICRHHYLYLLGEKVILRDQA